MQLGVVTGELTAEDCRAILASLEYTRRNVEQYAEYPSYQFKVARLKEVYDLMQKVRKMRDRLKGKL